MKKSTQHARAGTAMTEMVLVLPFLVFILLLVMYFGKGVVRLQHAQVMDRYEAWRLADGAPGPAANVQGGSAMMNQSFFGGAAQSVSADYSSAFPTDAADEFELMASNVSTDAKNLVTEAFDDFPKGATATMTTTHNESVALWQKIDQPVKHRHVRIGNDWAYSNRWVKNNKGEWVLQHADGTWILPPARDVFYDQLDNTLENLDQGGNRIAEYMRGTYLDKPAYRGPTINMP